jgi:hypothetical protein
VALLWIGTNDLGGDYYLEHLQKQGTTAGFADCIFEALGMLYDVGMRRFLLLNVAPLGMYPSGVVYRGGVESGAKRGHQT